MAKTFDYDDIDSLKAALVGRKIINLASEGSEFNKVDTFVLDDGSLLKAHAADGGCACSNGCFSVESSAVGGTIMSISLDEHVEGEEGIITVFVMTDMESGALVRSEGGDNGYYGWGFTFSVTPGKEA